MFARVLIIGHVNGFDWSKDMKCRKDRFLGRIVVDRSNIHSAHQNPCFLSQVSLLKNMNDKLLRVC